MNSMARLLGAALATGTVAAAGLLVTMGTAQAQGYDDYYPYGPDQQYRVHSETRTAVHNSGGGGTAVNATGGGTAGLNAYQQKPDGSRHEDTDYHPRVDSHNVSNSHNTYVSRDSHVIDRDYYPY
jgi:hypothetical protein